MEVLVKVQHLGKIVLRGRSNDGFVHSVNPGIDKARDFKGVVISRPVFAVKVDIEFEVMN